MSKPNNNSGNIGSYLTSLFGKQNTSTTKKQTSSSTSKKKTSQIEVAKQSSTSGASSSVVSTAAVESSYSDDVHEIEPQQFRHQQQHHLMEDDEIVEQHSKRVVLMTTEQQLLSAHTIVDWKERQNQGKILVEYGDSNIENVPSESDVKIVKPTKSGTVKYMYDKVYKQSSVLLERLEEVGAKILEHHNIESAKPLNYHSDQPEVYIGRILSESVTGDDKLNPSSILLEGLSNAETSDCKIVKLNFDKFGIESGHSQTLFPGQVVAIKGLNSVQSLKVEKIYTGAPLDQSPQDNQTPPPTSSNEKKKIKIMVACGPFTLPHNVLYSPLKDLITLVETNEPNVLILVGPFLSEDNSLIKSGFMDETHDTTFENRFIAKLKTIETANCRVVLIPSLKDVNSDFVFPQPAIEIENASTGTAAANKIQCFSNPSTFSITSPSFNTPLKIGVTSLDAIKTIKEKEYTFGYVEDQTEHYLKTLLEQQYYYPRMIPSSEIPLDHSLINGTRTSLKIEESPNIIILPSDQLESCCKVIDNTIVINPTRLCDNQHRKEGSYALIDIVNDTSSLDKRVHVQVVNI